MNLFHLRLLSLLAWNLWATVSQAAGFTPLQIPASQDGPALQGAVWTPCGASPGPITLEDLSSEFGVSRERVRQIEVRAFEKVQDAVKRNLATREAPRAGVPA